MGMSQKRRRRLLVRVPLVTAVLTALFWGVWYLITGSVPVINLVAMNVSLSLSRWTDVLIVPVFVFLLILLFTNRKVREGENDDLVNELTFGLIIGLCVGLILGLLNGPIMGLIFGPIIGLAIGLVTEAIGEDIGLVAVLSVEFGVGLGVGLIHGMVYGLIPILSVLIIWPIVCISKLVWDWMMAVE